MEARDIRHGPDAGHAMPRSPEQYANYIGRRMKAAIRR